MKFAKIVVKGAAVYAAFGTFLGAFAIVGKRHIVANPEEYPDDVTYICKMSDAKIMSNCITKWPLVFMTSYNHVKSTK